MNTASLPLSWSVPQEFRDRLGAKVGRQRAFEAEGHLLLVLHRPPRPDEDERSGRYLWRRPDGTWNSSDLGLGPQALHKHLEEYADVVEGLDRQEEAAATPEDYFRVQTGLAPLHRAARNLHKTLEDARRLCSTDRELINARDRAYEIERSAELLLAETKHSLDFLVARREEEQTQASRRMAVAAHRLNLLAAFFFPLATLSALFGMNIRHGLEDATAPVPFLALLGTGLGIGCALTFFVIARAEPANGQGRPTRTAAARPKRRY